MLQDNPHRLTLTMVPEDEYLAKQEAEEKERLAKKVATLSDSDRQKIIARGELEYCLHSSFPLAKDHCLGGKKQCFVSQGPKFLDPNSFFCYIRQILGSAVLHCVPF